LLCRTDTAQHVLGIIMPIIRSPSNCCCSLLFPYGFVSNKPTTAEKTSTSTFIRKPEAATAVWRAPDDGHNNARNMLSSVCTTKQISLLLTNRPRLRILPPPHSYRNQRLQRQFDGLLMMGIIMPETCWSVSVQQSNKILQLIVASSWVLYLSDWRCMEPQNLKTHVCS